MILVDTNVLLDVVSDHPRWADRSQQQLEAAAIKRRLAINAVIYAGLSIGFRRIEELEAVLARTQIGLEEIPREALFLAGKAFQRYKKRAARAPACCRTSSSARTRRCSASRCSRATRGATPTIEHEERHGA